MGNLMPVDGAKKEECEEIAKEFVATFSAEYVLAYGAEFTKFKMKQIDEEALGDVETEKELMYRKDAKCTEPHKMGALTKKGAIVKNWKHRYFVVNPNFSVSYYETEEGYHQGVKPKGVMQLAGYEIAECADSSKIEQLKAVAKKMGMDEQSLPLPEKFPPHTLAVAHERRRTYYITAADEDEKKEWVEMFKTCCRKTKGFQNEDPVAQAAFVTAFKKACRESNWYKRVDPSGGTEEQLLSETLVEIIECRVISSVYEDVTTNYTIRKKIRSQIIKMLDGMVLALVVPAYKGLVETTEKMKIPMEKLFNETKDQIGEVQKKITSLLAEAMETILNTAIEGASDDIKKMYEDLKELTVKTSAEMRNECVVRLMDRLIKDTKESEDVAAVMKKHYRRMDNIVHSTTGWDHWYKVYNMERGTMSIMDKYKDTFNMGGSYRYLYASHDMLSEVADAAFFTFEQTLEERTKDSDILKDKNKASETMTKVKDEVIPKYDNDSKATPHDVSFHLITMHLVEYVSNKIDPLTKDIRRNAENAIPEAIKQLVSIQERYEFYTEESVKELIRRAIGIPKLEKKGKPKESEKPVKQNGEMKNGMSHNEQEMKEKKVDESDGKENGTKRGEVQENGTTTEENGVKKEKVEKNEKEESENKKNGETQEEKSRKNGSPEECKETGNGKTENGETENGETENGKTENGKTENGETENGETENGETENGETENRETENGETENGVQDSTNDTSM